MNSTDAKHNLANQVDIRCACLQATLKGSIEREKRQLDRLMTALKLIETDASYYRCVVQTLQTDVGKPHSSMVHHM